jgi:hypothetical protein
MIENLIRIASTLFHRNIYKAVCLHLQLYCGVDVTMVTNEVNKFGQIFSIHMRGKYKGIGNFHPFFFTSKSHLRKIKLYQGYSTFFFQTYFRITLYIIYVQRLISLKIYLLKTQLTFHLYS